MFATLLAGIVLALAQGRERAKPELCPYCHDDPLLLKAAGLVSHGPFPLAAQGTAELVATLPAAQWVFLESAHLRLASCLGEDTLDQRDKARVEAELARLRAVLPDVPVKPRKLDPWLRLHLFAMKGEEFYARFQALLRVTDADFPEQRTLAGPYMGAGKFLGERDKFEVVIHATRANHQRFTESFSGVRVNDSFRWHFKESHKLIVSVPAEDADLREDRWLWPHIVHNLSHAFLCAYKHFSYDPPVWIDEGLAVALELEVEPESRTSEGEEGSLRDTKGPGDYPGAVKRLVAGGKAQSLALLWNAKQYSELGRDGTLQAWSLARFLLDAHGDAFARFLGGLKGQLDAQNMPSGEDLPGLQRRLLKDLWGWTPAALEQAWAAWVKQSG